MDSDDEDDFKPAAKPTPVAAKKGIFAGGSDDDSDDFKPAKKPEPVKTAAPV
jgi:hypothetical protein